jgi:hypothetical protein
MDYESLGFYSIFGETYQLVVDDEGFYLLLDEDEDKMTIPLTLTYKGDDHQEKICELYLHSYDSYEYKHPNFTSLEWINMFEKIYSKGVQDGRKQQLGLLIEDLEKDYENM